MSTEVLTPDSTVTLDWVIYPSEGGDPTAQEATDDGMGGGDSTGIEETSGFQEVAECGLSNPVGTPNLQNDWTLKVRAKHGGTAPVSFTVEVREGATVRHTFSPTLTSSYATYTSVFDPNDAIVTNDLSLHVQGRAGAASSINVADWELLIDTTPAVSVLTQAKFRARFNNGSEATATWIDAADTDWKQVPNTVFRLRFLIQIATAGEAGKTFDIQYRHDAGSGYGAWTAISNTSSVVRARNTGNTTEGEDCTDQGLGAGTFTSDNNGMTEASAASGSMTTVAGEEFDLEYVLSIRKGDVGSGDLVQVRVLKDGVVLDTYTATPTMTIKMGAGPPPPPGGAGRRNNDSLKRGYLIGKQPCKTIGRTWKAFRHL